MGPGTTWSMIEGRGYIAAAHRGRCDSFLLLEELPWVVRPLGNNGRCLLGAQGRVRVRLARLRHSLLDSPALSPSSHLYLRF